MIMKHLILLYFGLCLFVSCSPKITSQIIERQPQNDGEVFVLLKKDDLPNDARKIGTITVSPRYFTTTKGGTLDRVIDKGKLDAKRMGGNVIVITQHKAPSISKATHYIEADVYAANTQLVEKSDTHSADYSSIWLYRYMWADGFSYDVFLDDKVVYSSIGGTKAEIRITKAGKYTIWATTGQKKVSYSLDVKLGRDYYVETNIWSGLLIPNPLFIPVSTISGKMAIAEITRNLVVE